VLLNNSIYKICISLNTKSVLFNITTCFDLGLVILRFIDSFESLMIVP